MPIQPTALDVAKLLLSWANKDGEVITNLKLQKLLYYAQAWYLVNFGRPLFSDSIEAWELGPVIPSVYRRFKANGPLPIDYQENGREGEVFAASQLRYLEEFYEIFHKYTAHVLVNMTHNEKPWKQAFETGKDISPESMKAFYTKLLREKKTNRNNS